MMTKVLHTLLALSVFISTTGFTLSQHYCRNELQGVGFFAPKEHCQHSKMAPCCKDHQGCALHQEKEQKGCCHNTLKYFKLEQVKEFLPLGFKIVKKPAILFVIQTVPTLSRPTASSFLPFYQLFKPPIVCDDLLIRLQTFRL